MSERPAIYISDKDFDRLSLMLDEHKNGGSAECVSVLAPAGAALLGLTVGDRIDWPVDAKNVLKLKIIHVA